MSHDELVYSGGINADIPRKLDARLFFKMKDSPAVNTTGINKRGLP